MIHNEKVPPRLKAEITEAVSFLTRKYTKQLAPLFKSLPRKMALAGVDVSDVKAMLHRVLHPPKP